MSCNGEKHDVLTFMFLGSPNEQLSKHRNLNQLSSNEDTTCFQCSFQMEDIVIKSGNIEESTWRQALSFQPFPLLSFLLVKWTIDSMRLGPESAPIRQPRQTDRLRGKLH